MALQKPTRRQVGVAVGRIRPQLLSNHNKPANEKQDGIAEAAFAAQLFDGHTGYALLNEADDLFFGEPAFLHVRHSLG